MNFPIIDSHVHLWDNTHLTYPWLKNFPLLNKSFLLSELMDATKALHIESFLFVQAECDPAQALNEVNWVGELAKRDARIHNMVAYAPLENGKEVDLYLQEIKKFAYVKGVRRILENEPTDFCLQQNFIDGIQLLAAHNLSFDICIRPSHLPAVTKLVTECPQVNFILDHMGKPNIAAKELKPWQENLKKLAGLPNVWCKISGVITEANHQTWCFEDIKPYIFHALDVFGINRVMFGSDWPMVNLAGSYSYWVHALYDLLMHSPKNEWHQLFYENAKRCYSLQSTLVEV